MCTAVAKLIGIPILDSSCLHKIAVFAPQLQGELILFQKSDRLGRGLSSISIRQQLDALFTSLENNPDQESSWAMLGVVLRGQLCPPALRARLRVMMER
jgi:hypothetical protein